MALHANSEAVKKLIAIISNYRGSLRKYCIWRGKFRDPSVDQISIKAPNPTCRPFLKIDQ
jgi:hypothetical protein